MVMLIFFFSTYIYGDLKFHQRVQVTGKVSNIKSLLCHQFQFIVPSSRFKLLLVTYVRLFQGPKVANCTRHRNIYTRWAPDICTYVHTILCEGDKVRESSFNRQLQGFKIMSSTNFSPFDTHAH